jgi:hypothetical protein
VAAGKMITLDTNWLMKIDFGPIETLTTEINLSPINSIRADRNKLDDFVVMFVGTDTVRHFGELIEHVEAMADQ